MKAYVFENKDNEYVRGDYGCNVEIDKDEIIKLPKTLMKVMGWKKKDLLDVTINGDQIVIKREYNVL